MKTLKPALHIKEFKILAADVQWADETRRAEASGDEARLMTSNCPQYFPLMERCRGQVLTAPPHRRAFLEEA